MPSTNPAIAPRSGPPAAPAAAAKASTNWMMTPKGVNSTNSVFWSASSTMPMGTRRGKELLRMAPSMGQPASDALGGW